MGMKLACAKTKLRVSSGKIPTEPRPTSLNGHSRKEEHMRATLTRRMVTLMVVLGVGCASHVFGDTSIAKHQQKTFKGMATRVDPAEKAVLVKGFWGTKRFNVASDCKVLMQDKADATLTDLRPGQRLEVTYERAEGVLVGHRIAQQNQTFTGFINEMDPAKHSLTLRRRGLDKTFEIAEDCKVILRDEKTGTMAEVQPGNRVTVTYEVPNGSATARRIAQTSAVFSGELIAIDLTDRTLKANALRGMKAFNVADDCRIVMSGKQTPRLSDLKLGDKLVLSYEDVSGVHIVNRIATVETPSKSSMTAAGQSHDSYTPDFPTY